MKNYIILKSIPQFGSSVAKDPINTKVILNVLIFVAQKVLKT
jgi:hypothetical protein